MGVNFGYCVKMVVSLKDSRHNINGVELRGWALSLNIVQV